MGPTKNEVKRDLLDVDGAAEYLGMSKSWVYHQTAAGTLPHRKVGSKLRFLSTELADWVARQPGAASGV